MNTIYCARGGEALLVAPATNQSAETVSYWPAEKPLPECHWRRPPMPCHVCRALYLPGGVRATYARKNTRDTVNYKCRACGASFRLLVCDLPEAEW